MDELLEEFDRTYSKRYFVNNFIKGYFRFYILYIIICTLYALGMIYALFFKLYFNKGDAYWFVVALAIGFVSIIIFSYINEYYRKRVISQIEKYLNISYISTKYVFSPEYKLKKKMLVNEWLDKVFGDYVFSEMEFLIWLQNKMIIMKTFEYKKKRILWTFLLIIISMNVEEAYTSIIVQINMLEIPSKSAIGIFTILVICIVLLFWERMINQTIKDLSDLRYSSVIVTYKELEKIISEYIYLKSTFGKDSIDEIVM